MIWGWIKFKDKFWLTSVGGNLVRRSTYFLTRFTVITSTPVLSYNKQNKLKYHQVSYPSAKSYDNGNNEDRKKRNQLEGEHQRHNKPEVDPINIRLQCRSVYVYRRTVFLSFCLRCCRCRGFS